MDCGAPGRRYGRVVRAGSGLYLYTVYKKVFRQSGTFSGPAGHVRVSTRVGMEIHEHNGGEKPGAPGETRTPDPL